MSVLLDVNLLLACGWQTHVRHSEAVTWLDGLSAFFTWGIRRDEKTVAYTMIGIPTRHL